MNDLQRMIYDVSRVLLWPVLIAAIVCLVWVLIELGFLLYELWLRFRYRDLDALEARTLKARKAFADGKPRTAYRYPAGEQLLDRRRALPVRPHPQLPDGAPGGQAAQAAAGVRVLHAQAPRAHAHPGAPRPDARPHGHPHPAVAGADRPRDRQYHAARREPHDGVLGHRRRPAHRRHRLRHQHRARPHVRAGHLRHGVPARAARGRRPAGCSPGAGATRRACGTPSRAVEYDVASRGHRQDADDPGAARDAREPLIPVVGSGAAEAGQSIGGNGCDNLSARYPGGRAGGPRRRWPARRRRSRSTIPPWTGTATRIRSPTSAPWIRSRRPAARPRRAPAAPPGAAEDAHAGVRRPPHHPQPRHRLRGPRPGPALHAPPAHRHVPTATATRSTASSISSTSPSCSPSASSSPRSLRPASAACSPART